MQKLNALVWDCDEVLLDHMGGFYHFVKEHYDIHPKTTHPNDYDLRNWLGGISNAEVQAMIVHFNERSHEFGLLKPMEHNTVRIMNELREKFRNDKFIVLTKSGTGGHGEVLRKVNLMNVFGIDMFDEIVIIEMYESKKAALLKLQSKYNVKFLIDDYYKNIETAKELDIPAVMFKASHNHHFSDYNSEYDYVTDWSNLRLKIYEIMMNGR